MGFEKVITGQDVRIYFNGEIVGSAQSIEINIERELDEIYAMGEEGRPVAFKRGTMKYSGRLKIVYIDLKPIKDYIKTNSNRWPSFTLQAIPTKDAPFKNITVKDAEFTNYPISIELSEVVEQELEFKALQVNIE